MPRVRRNLVKWGAERRGVGTHFFEQIESFYTSFVFKLIRMNQQGFLPVCLFYLVEGRERSVSVGRCCCCEHAVTYELPTLSHLHLASN